MPESKATLPTSFRLTDADFGILADLEAALGLGRTDVVRLALRRLHRAEVAKTQRDKKAEKIPGKGG